MGELVRLLVRAGHAKAVQIEHDVVGGKQDCLFAYGRHEIAR